MRYFGGKNRIARKLAGYIATHIRRVYIEPFCGSFWVGSLIDADTKIASDACQPLITLLKAVQSGWQPPTELSEDDYNWLEAIQDPTDPMTAFAGFGCSFAGKWFGGYARCKRGDNYAKNSSSSLQKQFRNYAMNARNSLVKHTNSDVIFCCADYRALQPRNALIYCDPPYAGTTGYSAIGKFDWTEFWDTIRLWSLSDNTVLISEYCAPEDFTCVLEIATKTDIRVKTGREPRIERLFQLAECI